MLWTVPIDRAGTDDYLAGLAPAPGGGVFVAGGYPVPFVIRFDAAGNVVWEQTVSLGWLDLTRAVASDGAGGVYACGIGWVRHFDPDGLSLMPGTPEPGCTSLVTLRAGGVVSFWDYATTTTRVFADGTVGRVRTDAALMSGVLDPAGRFVALERATPQLSVVRLDPETFDIGATLTFGSPEDDYPFAIVSDAHGRIFVGGMTNGDLDGGADADRFSVGFVAKLGYR